MQPHDPEQPVQPPRLERRSVAQRVSRRDLAHRDTTRYRRISIRTPAGARRPACCIAAVRLADWLSDRAWCVRFFMQRRSRRPARRAYSTPPPVDVVDCPAGDRGPGSGASGGDCGVVRDHDLCARQRLCGQVAGGYRRSRQEGPGARDHRDAGTRCRVAGGSCAAQGLRGAGGARARPKPNSAKRPTSAGAIRPKEWCPSRSGSRRRPTTKARRRDCMRPMRRSISTNPRSISTARSPNSSR